MGLIRTLVFMIMMISIHGVQKKLGSILDCCMKTNEIIIFMIILYDQILKSLLFKQKYGYSYLKRKMNKTK